MAKAGREKASMPWTFILIILLLAFLIRTQMVIDNKESPEVIQDVQDVQDGDVEGDQSMQDDEDGDGYDDEDNEGEGEGDDAGGSRDKNNQQRGEAQEIEADGRHLQMFHQVHVDFKLHSETLPVTP